jgi:hypothetical protein
LGCEWLLPTYGRRIDVEDQSGTVTEAVTGK